MLILFLLMMMMILLSFETNTKQKIYLFNFPTLKIIIYFLTHLT